MPSRNKKRKHEQEEDGQGEVAAEAAAAASSPAADSSPAAAEPAKKKKKKKKNKEHEPGEEPAANGHAEPAAQQAAAAASPAPAVSPKTPESSVSSSSLTSSSSAKKKKKHKAHKEHENGSAQNGDAMDVDGAPPPAPPKLMRTDSLPKKFKDKQKPPLPNPDAFQSLAAKRPDASKSAPRPAPPTDDTPQPKSVLRPASAPKTTQRTLKRRVSWGLNEAKHFDKRTPPAAVSAARRSQFK